MENKSIEHRLRECADLRDRLRSLGILAIPDVAEKLKTHMNAFVSGGASEGSKAPDLATGGTPVASDTFVLRVETLRVRVILTAREGRQSGIELETVSQ